MINMFVMGLYCLFSFLIFVGSYRVNEVNRVFINMPKSIIENSVSIKEYNDQSDIYFVDTYLEENVNNYLESNLPKKAFDYTLTFNYLNNDGETYCFTDKCQGVKITIECNYFLDFMYKQSMVYTIGEAK